MPSAPTSPGWLRLAAAVLLLAPLGCGGDDGPADPDGPDPGPGDDPHLAESVLLDTGEDFFNDVPPDWSPDGLRVVFSARVASSVWTLSATPGAEPVLLTDPEVTSWSEGAYTPNYLGDGRVAYYMGWSDEERVMRIMAADTNQVEAEPPPSVLRRFTGLALGLSEYQASSPRLLSLSADGLRAVGFWRDVRLLDWRGAPDSAYPGTRSPEALIGATALRLSPDGERVVFVDAEGRVAWMTFDGNASHVLGQGAYPSWRGDGTAVGFVTDDGRAYRVAEIDGGVSVSYRTSGAELRHACLSWAGDAVIYLNRDGEYATLGLARLVEGGP